MSLSLDSAKARFKLGWRPRLSLEAALAQIVTWTKSYRDGKDMHLATQLAIQQFMDLG